MTKRKRKKTSKKVSTWTENLDDAVGNTTILSLNWKPWTEFPKTGDRIYVIIKNDNRLVPVTGVYFDETFPASKDGTMPKSRWQTVRFDEGGFAIIGGEGGDCLRAWARPRAIGKLLNAKCPLCKEVPCVC